MPKPDAPEKEFSELNAIIIYYKNNILILQNKSI
uniref:Uncharacterized protein n=1 Tax=viral metagenome TaxID=1070528 RepID=A0A6C0HCU1_9ZZZZ